MYETEIHNPSEYPTEPSIEKKKKLSKPPTQKIPKIEEIGPNPTFKLKVTAKEIIIDQLPSSKHYEKSFMHRDIVNQSNLLN
jgi:hypothetical protein